MLKKTITYVDFNGEEVSEDYYFHLSKAELVEMEMSHEGGLKASLERLIASEDGASIIKEFKAIILGAYGKKSPDGRRFIKTQELRDEFLSTEAYSVLFMDLVTDVESAITFIAGIVPAGLADDAAKLTRADLAVVPEQPPEESPTLPSTITNKELTEMSGADLPAVLERIRNGEVVIQD